MWIQPEVKTNIVNKVALLKSLKLPKVFGNIFKNFNISKSLPVLHSELYTKVFMNY